MQTSTDTPSKKPRHNPNPQKGGRRKESHTRLPTESQDPTAGIAMPSLLSSEPYQDTSRATAPVLNQIASSPVTPPRPRSMYEGTSTRQLTGAASADDTNGKRRKSSQGKQNQRPVPSPSNSRPNGTPRVQIQNNIQTPGRSSATPSQAYAGPTFHASPAPSSLPIPKFFQKQFSKSVPENTQANGLTALMDSEISEEAPSPKSSEASPVREKAERLQHQNREESPLDIFFRADREEKSRARLANITNHEHLKASEGEAGPEPNPFERTPSSGPKDIRHHSRHNTGGSAGGLFPIELEQERPQTDNPQSANFLVSQTHLKDSGRGSSAPSPDSDKASQEEIARRNARSADLMKLLGTEKPTKPVSPSQTSDRKSSPGTWKSASRPTREHTGPFAPTPQSGSKVQILSRKAPTDLPQLQKQFGASPSSSQSPHARPPSNLRQEVPFPPSPAQDVLQELPATPTPSHTAKVPLVSDENRNFIQGNTPSSLRTSALSGIGSTQTQGQQFSSMENDLRRILRLDILGSDAVNGV